MFQADSLRTLRPKVRCETNAHGQTASLLAITGESQKRLRASLELPGGIETRLEHHLTVERRANAGAAA